MARPRDVDVIVDTFAGPGGWDEGLALLGVRDVVGVEWDMDACRTAVAAGHLRLRADVAEYPTAPLAGADGVIASPPCQAYSLAGKQAGTRARALLLEHVDRCRDGWVPPAGELVAEDLRADLTLQPLRWVHDIRPRWVALEQVPPVIHLWRAIAAVFTRWGYSTVTTVLNAADYGVPQTRRRAILVARRDGRAQMPEPTHFDPRKGVSMFGEAWVSMAEALGWLAPAGAASMGDVRQANGAVRPLAEPAPTMTSSMDNGNFQWTLERPATTLVGSTDAVAAPGHRCMSDSCCGRGPRRHFDGKPVDARHWGHDRPATTVVGTFRPDIIAAPGWRGPGDGPRQDAPQSVRVSIQQAGVLQSFRPDYPWHGSKTSQWQQVGNAIPPVLAAAILRPVVT